LFSGALLPGLMRVVADMVYVRAHG